jgi:hypothetical protein
MKYLIMIYSNESDEQKRTEQQTGTVIQAYMAYSEALVKAGVMVGGERLRPSQSATRVQVKNGKSQVLNGPYAETKEQLGGYYMIDVPDLDAAITWAARCPGASDGIVEVRPVWAM